MTTEELRESLLAAPKNGFARITTQQRIEMNEYCKRYMAFMDACKTEREATDWAIAEAEKNGFKPFAPSIAANPGDKIYYNCRGKAIALAVIGTESLVNGANICAAHVDSPRMRIPRSLTSRPTTTAASKSTSGSPCLWRCTAWSTARMAPWSPSPSVKMMLIPS